MASQTDNSRSHFPIRRPAGRAAFHRPNLEPLEARLALDGMPIITEFMASSQDTIRDQNGDAEDWIEIFNRGDQAIDLAGWRLTDDHSALAKWTFPSRSLDPGEFLVVFASGKNRADDVGELHTNFMLDAAGEYLALVHPDGVTIAAEFGNFPQQEPDVSYGLQQNASTVSFIQAGAAAQVKIPSSDSLGTTWLTPEYVPDVSWTRGGTPVGFDQAGDGSVLKLDFNDVGSTDPIITDTETGFTAMTLAQNGATFNGVRVTFSAVGGATLDDRDRAVPVDNPPNFTQDQLYDDFIFANGTVDGAGLQIRLEGLAPNTEHRLTLWSFDDSSNGARVSDWTEIASGTPVIVETGFVFDGDVLPTANNDSTLNALLTSSSTGTLVLQGLRNGGTSHGVFVNALALSTPSFGDLVATNLQDSMFNANASAYVRVPFSVPTGPLPDILTLGMQYDAGFVAYLNGHEVARQNSPTSAGVPVAYNGAATAERAAAAKTSFDSFNVTRFADLLHAGGPNVLSIHGLNSAANHGDFLITPTLEATYVADGDGRFFDTPTPGMANIGGFLGFVGDTSFDVDRGFFETPFTLQIATATPGATIYYTTNGAAPGLNADSQMYLGPVLITTTTHVRAMAMREGFRSSNIDTQTYLFLDDVLTQDPLAANQGLVYPTVWQANAPADYTMDPAVVAEWDDNNPANDDFGIREALKSIPTMSIVMDHDDLWNASTGIYPNSNTRGDSWRRPGSVEYFDPATGDTFQVNVGVQMHGNASRDNVRLKKHSFRLVFSPEFGGPSRLNFPLFDDSEFTDINTVVMRASFTDAFATRTATDRYSPLDSQYTRDVWMRDAQLALGQPSAASTYVQLYINGLYWGMYSPAERPDDAFLAGHLGGEPADWDVIKDFNELFKGEKTAWNAMFALADQIPTAANPDVIFWQLQGRLPNGARDPALPVYLDMVNLVDFMLLHIYGGAEDWPHHNWYAGRNRVDPGDGFKFMVWDQEIVLDGRFRDVTNVGTATDHQFTPAELYHHLKSSPEFRLLFADRVQQHMFHGGALTVAANQARWMARANQVEKAIIAESARWGDAREGEVVVVSTGQPAVTIPVMTVDLWRAERDNVHDNYFPLIHEQTLARLRADGLWTDLGGPTFSQHGGEVPFGYPLTIEAPLAPVAVDTVLVPRDAPVSAWVPTSNVADAPSIGMPPRYSLSSFDDATWLRGTSGVGFDRGAGLGPALGLDLLNASVPASQRIDADGNGLNDTNSIYTRFAFLVDATTSLASIQRLTLNINYDDGFTLYLNGTRILGRNSTTFPTWTSAATATHNAGSFETFDLTNRVNLLLPGAVNVLAIHAMNTNLSDGDMLVQPELIVRENRLIGSSQVFVTTNGTDPRLPGGAIDAANSQLYVTPLMLHESAQIQARSYFAGSWGPLVSASFFVLPTGGGITLSEIHYQPSGPTSAELMDLPSATGSDFEFVEVYNSHPMLGINLLGMRLTDGVDFTFPSVTLGPGQFGIVVNDRVAFERRYGTEVNLLGEWVGNLANGGETLALVDANNDTIVTVSYADSDPWPTRAEGVGASLELIDIVGTPTDSYSQYNRWRASVDFGGSPSRIGSAAHGITISEIVSNSDQPGSEDAIELFNPTADAISIGGWFLSDSAGDLLKYEIPQGTVVQAGAFYVVRESQFNPTPAAPTQQHFALDDAGDDVWLVVPGSNRTVLQFVDDVHFDATLPGTSLGRDRNGQGRLVPRERISLGCENSPAGSGALVISEVHYAPTANDPQIPVSDLEFVEIFNPTAMLVHLDDWRLRGGIDFDFAAGTELEAGHTLVVVPFDPRDSANASRVAAFRSQYGIDATVSLVGRFSGGLGNAGEAVRLQRPGAMPPEPSGIRPYAVEDEVTYGSQAPWPVLGDGTGMSLHRKSAVWQGSRSNSWRAANATPGVVLFDASGADLDGDGQVTSLDIDRLGFAIATAQTHRPFDLNDDAHVDHADMEFLLSTILRVPASDANLDGAVDGSDFNAWNQRKFRACGGGWSDGDFTGDGQVDASDLNQWLANRFMTRPARGQVELIRSPRAALAQPREVDSAFAAW